METLRAYVDEPLTERRTHSSAQEAARSNGRQSWPIQVDSETDKQAWEETLRLAERHQLTLYDAAYLELALRRNLPLATLDKDLRRAGQLEKLRLLGK